MNSRRSLQIAVAIAGLVPVSAGALGALRPELLSLSGPPHAFTHAAYLSGLLLGLGLSFWSLIPTIERQRHTFTILTGLVVVGGLGGDGTSAGADQCHVRDFREFPSRKMVIPPWKWKSGRLASARPTGPA